MSLLALGSIIYAFIFFLNLYSSQKSALSNAPKRSIQQAFPADREFYETAFKFSITQNKNAGQNIIGGIIPHHLLAADLIADFFSRLKNRSFDTVVLVGPNHFSLGDKNIISSALDWQTPYGTLNADQELLKKLSPEFQVGIDEDVMAGEHAIKSEVAFIKRTFSKAKFLPLIIKPGLDMATARELGEKISALGNDKKILFLASVDFSHYRDSVSAQNDDRASIAAITNFEFDKIKDLELDSPATISALMAYAKMDSGEFKLLKNSNSALLLDQPEIQSTTSYVTGFFAAPASDQKQAGLPSANSSSSPLRMLFVGDMMLDRHIAEKIKQKGLNYIFDNLNNAGFFDNYDLISANLEGAVTDNGDHYLPIKSYDFAFDPDLVAALKAYNFTFFNLANNHLADQGEAGIEQTRANLDKLNYAYSGCEDGVIAECSSRIITAGDYTLGMIGLSGVGARLDSEKIIALISNLKEKTDLIIVNIHWGQEYALRSNQTQQSLAHKMIDAGADAIIGHHPHVIQEIEIYKNKPIFYSLGNFIFDQYFSPETQAGLAVELTYVNNELEYNLHPLKSTYAQLNLMPTQDKEKLLQRINP